MGMFDAFLGQNTGYTKAQSAGLRRSAEIKRRRKEDERAFEKQKMEFEAREARVGRATTEAGETLRTGMRVRGGLEQQRMATIGQTARQRLVGRQQREAATTAAVRAADVESMEYGRKKTLGEIEHGYAMEEAKVKGPLGALYEESPDSAAREGLPGNQKEYTFAQFTDLPLEKQKPYMSYIKKHDPEKFLGFARQWKLLAAPEKEKTDADFGAAGRSVYQSDSGTYRNY